MSDQSAPADGGTPEAPPQETAPEPAGPPEWATSMAEKLDELGQTTSQLGEQFAHLQQPEYDDDGFEEEQAPDYYDDDGDLTEDGARHLIGQEVDTRVNAILSERDAARALEDREDAFDALRDEIPALADEKLAQRLVHDTVEWCLRSGNEHLIERPEFVELIEDRFYREQYLASQQNGEEGEREVVLESAAGAAPARKKDEVDWGQRVLDAANRLQPGI
jgi:hypothetical protein